MENCAGVFIVCMFIFVHQLHFSDNELLGLGIAVGLLRISPSVRAGARIGGAAMFVFSCWAIVLAGALVSHRLAGLPGFPMIEQYIRILAIGALQVT